MSATWPTAEVDAAALAAVAALTPASIGADPAGAAASAQAAAQSYADSFGQLWRPEDHGYLAWNEDVYASGGTALPSVGRLHLFRVPVRKTITFSRIVCHVAVAGATLANVFLAAYSKAGVLLGATADLSATFAPTGMKDHPVSGAAVTVQRSEDWFRLGILIGAATTVPNLGANQLTLSSIANANQAASDLRSATAAPVSLTAPPASIVPASLVSFGNRVPWFAVAA